MRETSVVIEDFKKHSPRAQGQRGPVFIHCRLVNIVSIVCHCVASNNGFRRERFSAFKTILSAHPETSGKLPKLTVQAKGFYSSLAYRLC